MPCLCYGLAPPAPAAPSTAYPGVVQGGASKPSWGCSAQTILVPTTDSPQGMLPHSAGLSNYPCVLCHHYCQLSARCLTHFIRASHLSLHRAGLRA